MSESSCHRADDAAPFAIGALDRVDAAAFERHLETCASCRAEVAELQELARVLPLAAEPQQPPPELKQRLMSVVRAEAELLRAAGPDLDRVASSSPSRAWWQRLAARPLAVAGGLAAVAALAFAAVILSTGGGDTRTVQARVAASNAKAQIVLHGGSGTLSASGMPAPGAGHVYAIWTQRTGEEPRLAATVRSSPGGAMRSELDLESVRAVMVTIEPARVGRTPTTSPVVVADIA